MAKRVVILNGDNELGHVIAKQFSPDHSEVVIATENQAEVHDPDTNIKIEHVTYNEDFNQDLAFAQEEINSLIAITEISDQKANENNLAEQVWPWIFVLKYLFRRKIPLPRYVVIVLAGYDPGLASLQAVQAKYITASNLDIDIHINLVNADFYHPGNNSLNYKLSGNFRPGVVTSAEQISDAVTILCSGLMDGMKAQSVYLRMGLTAPETDIAIDGGPTLVD